MEIFLLPLGGYVKMHGDADEASTKQSKDNIDPKDPFTTSQLAKGHLFYLQVQRKFHFSIILLVFINCFYGFTSTKPIISEIEKICQLISQD